MRRLWVLLLMFMLGAFAAEAQKMDEKTLNTLKNATFISEVRKSAIVNSAGTVKAFFAQRAQMRWQRISNEYSEEQINDFFLGAVSLNTSNTDYGCLYNPWWDAVLLFKLSGLPDVPKVDNFCLASGCKFRREENLSAKNLQGTVPQDARPYAVDLWDITSRTTKYFKESFSGNEGGEFARLQVNDAADTERIQVRSAVRLKLLLKFLQNKSMQRESRRICNYLAAGHEEKMLKYFKDPFGAGFVKSYASIAGELRQNFVPYCYFPGPNGVLFVFFNSDFPRVLVTVTYPRKGFDRILEWYDLSKSSEYLAKWNSVKEGK